MHLCDGPALHAPRPSVSWRSLHRAEGRNVTYAIGTPISPNYRIRHYTSYRHVHATARRLAPHRSPTTGRLGTPAPQQLAGVVHNRPTKGAQGGPIHAHEGERSGPDAARYVSERRTYVFNV